MYPVYPVMMVSAEGLDKWVPQYWLPKFPRHLHNYMAHSFCEESLRPYLHDNPPFLVLALGMPVVDALMPDNEMSVELLGYEFYHVRRAATPTPTQPIWFSMEAMQPRMAQSDFILRVLPAPSQCELPGMARRLERDLREIKFLLESVGLL